MAGNVAEIHRISAADAKIISFSVFAPTRRRFAYEFLFYASLCHLERVIFFLFSFIVVFRVHRKQRVIGSASFM